MHEPCSRRQFFYGALLAGAVPAAGFGSAPSLRQLGYRSPNEKLNIACIGAGGRATINIDGCLSENIVSFADPDDASVAPTYKRFPKATAYRDFRRTLDKEAGSIDAVIISAPDHVHAVASIACMERGKHLYVEKPLTRTIWEARFLAEAAAKHKVATQMGNQGYSNEGARIAAEIVWSGEIGDVTEVRAWTDRPIWPQGIAKLPPEEKVPSTLDWDVWVGPAAMRPYNPAYCPFNWRGWFDFGSGALGDIACHVLGMVNMALRLGAPSSVEVVERSGRNPYTFAARSVTHFQFPARGAMPPLKIVWTDGCSDGPPWRPPELPNGEEYISGGGALGANGVLYTGAGPVAPRAGGRSTVPAAPAAPKPARTGSYGKMRLSADASAVVLIGTRGYLTADTYGANIRLLPESRNKEYKLPPQLLTRSPGHYRDWIRACKGGEAACSNFAVAAPFTEIVQLGALAARFDGKLEWDSARMRVTNNAAANQYVKPIFRKGWILG